MFGINQVPPSETIKLIVKIFGSLFSNIAISQPQGTAASKLVKVPLEFGSKQKWYYENTADPNKGITSNADPTLNQNPYERQFPRMVYTLENMQYAKDRKLSTTQQNVSKKGSSVATNLLQYIPVPYNFTFKLSIGTKNLSEAWQIVEQIVVYFQPYFTISPKWFDDSHGPVMDQNYEALILLKGAPEFDIEWMTDYDKMRKVETEMMFDFQGYLFLPTIGGPQSNIINNITLKYDPFETDQITGTQLVDQTIITDSLTPQ